MSRGLSARGSAAQRRREMGVTNRESGIRIGLDARSIFMPRPRGTGRNLLDAYQRIPSMRPEWQFALYHQRNVACEALRELPNVQARRIDIPGDRFDLWFQLRLPAAAWRDGVDLLHLPANAAPRRSPVPFVATVHDLVPLTDAGGCSEAQRQVFRRGVARAVRGAVHIISPSNATRDELCERFDVDPDRVTVSPWAPDRGIAGAVDGRPPSQTGSNCRFDLAHRPIPPRLVECAGLTEVAPVGCNRGQKLSKPGPVGGNGGHHGRAPSARRAHVEHSIQIGHSLVGARSVGLVHDKHIADFEKAGLCGLD